MQLIVGQADGIRTWAIPAAGATEPGMPAKELKAGDGCGDGARSFPGVSAERDLRRLQEQDVPDLEPRQREPAVQPEPRHSGDRDRRLGGRPDPGDWRGERKPADHEPQRPAGGGGQGNPGLDRAAFRANEELTVAKSKGTLADTAVKESEKEVTAREKSLKKAMENQDQRRQGGRRARRKSTRSSRRSRRRPRPSPASRTTRRLKKAKEDAEAALKKLTDARDTAMQQVASADRAIQLAQQSLENAKKRVTETKQRLEGAQAVSKQAEDAANAAKQTAAQGIKPVRSVAFSKDGKTIAVGGDDGLIQLWSRDRASRWRRSPATAGRSRAGVLARRHAALGECGPEGDRLERPADLEPGGGARGEAGQHAGRVDVPFVDRVLAAHRSVRTAE